MRLLTTSTCEVAVHSVGDALAGATPEEFAAVFLRLSERLLNDHEKLMALAEAMSPDQGANRKIVLKELLARIVYFEGKSKWEPLSEIEDANT